MRIKDHVPISFILAFLVMQSCGGSASDADLDGVGATCIEDFDCDQETLLACITRFKGGYCSLPGCTADSDCPSGSICVADPGSGTNYCFLTCTNDDDCNFYRDDNDAATCSSDIVRVGAGSSSACVPQPAAD